MPAKDVYDELSRVHRPLQDRSRLAQVGALDALETMLRERPLHKVTVQEVADRAGLSITSVYARFDGKNAMVLALHERVIQDALHQLHELLDEAAEHDESVERTVNTLIARVVDFADENAHVFSAVLSASDEETNQRAAAFIRSASAALAAHLVPRLSRPGRGIDRGIDRDIDFAWRTTMALLQQSWALGGAEPARYPLAGTDLAARLSRQFLDAVVPAD